MLEHIDATPGLSAWELSQVCGLEYSGVQKGLIRLREYSAVRFEAENREAGGVRYRYHPGQPAQRVAFLQAVREAEAKNGQ